MFVAYCATALLIKSYWTASILAYSLAVSIKMNVLLMAPPVLLVLLKVVHSRKHARACSHHGASLPLQWSFGIFVYAVSYNPCIAQG